MATTKVVGALDPVLYGNPDHSKVTFQELLYYARIQREQEAIYQSGGIPPEKDPRTTIQNEKANPSSSSNSSSQDVSDSAAAADAEKRVITNGQVAYYDQLAGLDETAKEQASALRALKSTTWVGVFYLITTDILGPYATPYAMAQMGYVPGNILFIVMGFCAWWAGMILCHVFNQLDSTRYPIKTYGDLAHRLCGPYVRFLCTSLQTLQLIVNVALLCLTNGQALSQVITGAPGNHTVCFVVCIAVFGIINFLVAQIRSLKGIGVLASTAVYQNLIIVVVSMAAIIKYGPDIPSAQASFGKQFPFNVPMFTSTFAGGTLFNQVNGASNMIFSYGGAMIFPEILAEMRRPMDFWKGMVCAQGLIVTVYLVYANVVYAFQGQYVLSQSYNGVPKYAFQTVCNVLAMMSGATAGALYGNIGLKVIYTNVVEQYFKGPALMTRKGSWVWGGSTVLYWAVAFIIAAAFPQVSSLSGLLAAITIQNFSYSFPFMFGLVFLMKKDAMIGEPLWEPGQPLVQLDTWKDASRWKRACFQGTYHLNLYFTTITLPSVLVKLVLFCCSLGGYAFCCMGMWAGDETAKSQFANGASGAFSCTPPV